MNYKSRMQHIVLAAVLCTVSALAFAPPAFAAMKPEVTLAKAYAKLQAGEVAAAIKLIRAALKRDPKNVQAMGMLGTAQQSSKQFTDAIASFRRLLSLKPDSPKAMYSLGALYAKTGNTEMAFDWLNKAKSSRKFDMSVLQTDPNVESLRNDSRFRDLLPTAEDFTKPFVEDIHIIREWDGEEINDQFGWIARNIGDVDGDGIPDVVTSAPTKTAGAKKNAGRVYVYSTGSGKLRWQVDGKANEQLGTGLEGAGDTNHDGTPDVIVGAPGSDTAYVLSGKDGSTLLTLHAEKKGDTFGQHVSTVGDINHDGHSDVIVGAPSNSSRGKAAGRAYVYSGDDGQLLFTFTGERAGDAFGSTVTGYTDAKQSLIVVGAPGAGPRKTGRIYVYDGSTGKLKFTADSDTTGSALGAMFVAVVGDVDGDGFVDVFASDYSNSAKGLSTGRVYVYSGATGETIRTFTGTTAGEGFGTTHSTTGDVDRDGHADLLVGAWQYSDAAIAGGRAYLFSGKDSTLLRTYTCRTPGDTFGFDAVSMGDIDGDGSDDFLVTSAWSGVKGFHSGRMFLISSGVSTSAANKPVHFQTQ